MRAENRFLFSLLYLDWLWVEKYCDDDAEGIRAGGRCYLHYRLCCYPFLMLRFGVNNFLLILYYILFYFLFLFSLSTPFLRFERRNVKGFLLFRFTHTQISLFLHKLLWKVIMGFSPNSRPWQMTLCSNQRTTPLTYTIKHFSKLIRF